MATNFPNSPSNGDTHTFGGATYTYNSARGAWLGPSSGGGGGASVTVSETAPSSPSEGDLWFDPSVLKTFVYYNDGTANQWVQNNPTGGGGSGGGASVTVSETAPSSPSAGDLWWDSAGNRMFIYYTDADSSQWVQATTPGADGADGADGAPATGYGQVPIVYTEPPTTHTLNSDGSTSTVQMQAVDPEGTAITYAIAYANSTNALPDQLYSATTINQTTGTYTFTPSSNSPDGGTFKARLSASDGITSAARFVDFSLSFTFSNLLTTSMVFDHYNAAGSPTRFTNAAYGMTYNHLDATLSTSQFGAHNASTPAYLAVYIGTEAKAVNQIKFNMHSNHFGDFELQGSNDANTSGTFYNTGTWTALTWASGTIGTSTLTGQNGGGSGSGKADHTIVTNNYTNSTGYTHYRVVINNVNNWSTGSGSGGWASYGWEMNRV